MLSAIKLLPSEADQPETREVMEMETRVKLLEARGKEAAERLQQQQEQLHHISIQLARVQALQDALTDQGEQNQKNNNDQHMALFTKLDLLIKTVAMRRGWHKGFGYKIVAVLVLVLLVAATTYYVPEVHDIFHHILGVVQKAHP